jgi:hypothetical protein
MEIKRNEENVSNQIANEYYQQSDYTLTERANAGISDTLTRLPEIATVQDFKPRIIETIIPRYHPVAAHFRGAKGKKLPKKKYYRHKYNRR